MQQLRQLVALLLVAVSTHLVCAETATDRLFSQSDPAIQAQILAVYDSKSEIEACPHIQAMKEAADDTKDKEKLVRQLAIFAVTPPRPQEMHDLLTLVVLHRLELPPSTTIRVLAPLLDSENEKLGGFARNWFQPHDSCGSGPSSLECLNYSDYLNYVRGQLNRHEETPSAFIEYIYERSPAQALLIFAQANPQRRSKMIANLQEISKQFEARQKQQKSDGLPGIPPMPRPKEIKPDDLAGLQLPQFDPREVRLAEVIISNAIRFKGFDDRFHQALPEAKQQLEKLANHSEWWARLYVVHIMRRHPELRISEVQEKLCEDSNELVSRAAKGGKRSAAALPPVVSSGAPPLVAPREAEARAIGPTSIEVTWQPSLGATSYALQRRQPDTESEYTIIAPNVTGTSYKDTGLARDTLYEYRVRAKSPD